MDHHNTTFFPLLQLPPEIILHIVKRSGWTLSFRLSCKTIAAMYKGGEYERDTCVPRFYHHWNQVTRLPLPRFPNRLEQSVEKEPEDIVHHSPVPMSYEEQEDVYCYYLIPDKPLFALVDFKIHGNIADIAGIELIISHMPGGRGRCSFVIRDFVQEIIPGADGSLSPFPSLFPMLLQTPRHVCVQVYPRRKRVSTTEGYSISWTSGCYGKWLQEIWRKGERVTFNRHFLAKFCVPHMIQGWAIKVPPEHLPHITTLNFHIHETKEHDILIQLQMDVVGKRHAQFPYPLDPSRYIVIPLNKGLIPYLQNGYMEGVEVTYDMSDDMKHYLIDDTDLYLFVSYTVEHWGYGGNSMGIYIDYDPELSYIRSPS